MVAGGGGSYRGAQEAGCGHVGFLQGGVVSEVC